jgi:putative transposase
MIHCDAVHARQIVETQKGPSMQFVHSIFRRLLKPIVRQEFRAIVERHDGDAYDKTFTSWEHLVALIFAQLHGATDLRGLEAAFNANVHHHHYHLHVGELSRSTLSDANARRPIGVFADTFAMLSERALSRRHEHAELGHRAGDDQRQAAEDRLSRWCP